MTIIDIAAIPGRHIDRPGMTRTIKDVLVTKTMTTHLGIIPPAQSTSEHSHPSAEEIAYVVQGVGRCRVGAEAGELRVNNLLFVPEGVSHQYTNIGSEDLVIFVVYSPPADVPKQ